MKTSLFILLTALLSLSVFANETNCEPHVLSGNEKTGEITVEFKRFESGRTVADEKTSDLLVGDELISVVLPVGPNDGLKWEDANQITNRSFEIIKTELMFKGEFENGVKFFEIDATVEMPQEIADKYNGGGVELVLQCTETISTCQGLDC